ncbi:MAG: hypothetical protein DDT30_00994 [Dehalococcoidia bacterium]|nr:hypothetical protein [Bacillota bacterium]MBT9142284.1 hypothetical protein [Bacillota bacterium]
MSGAKVISISQKTIWSDISDIVKNRRFDYIPAIAYITRDNGEEKGEATLLYCPKPFSLWGDTVTIEIFCRYARDEIERKEELKVARKAYLKLRNFANRCAERVLADLTCAVILKTWNNSTDQFIYFMEGPPSDKFLARLSCLYPSLENLTICFISFKPEDLITAVMSFQTGRLQFDIHRLISAETTGFQGPYPGSSEDSLVQTYFYTHPEVRSGIKVSPIRVDIFCQGLLESDIDEKKEIIWEKVNDETWTSPYLIKDPLHVILPKGLIEVIKSWEERGYDKRLEEILKTQDRKGG